MDGERHSIRGSFDNEEAAARAGNKAISDAWHRSAGLDYKAPLAKACCDIIRQPFFEAFARVFNDVVTNVYPLVKDATFNDNIFVSNSLLFDEPLVGTLDILAPNLISGMRRESKNAAIREMKTRDDKCLHYAKKIYSDHVHVSVSLRREA